MNYQYNQQPAPQQQPMPQQMPQQPMPQPRPYVDPMIAKQRKKAAFDALGEKLADFMSTNPVLSAISRNSDIISYIATGASALITIILMILGRFSIIFPVATIILAAFAISKKQMLPLAISVSYTALFSLICFIENTVYLAEYAKWVSGAFVISYIFSILEVAILGYLAYLCWAYFAALLPPKAYVQQPYYGQPMQQQAPAQQPQYQQPVQQQAPVQQPAQPAAPVQQQAPVQQPAQPAAQAPVQQQAPAQQPAQPAAPAEKTCASCGVVNAPDAAFCRGCGNKLN